MIVKTSTVRLLTMMSASVFISLCASALQEECPKACPATASNSSSGTVPPGVSLLLTTYGTTVSGSATDICATCEQCSQPISVQYNGNGHGYCIRFDHGGTGWSNWLNHFSRFGVLLANCAFD